MVVFRVRFSNFHLERTGLCPDRIMIVARDKSASSPVVSRPRHRWLGRRLGGWLDAIIGTLHARRLLKRAIGRPRVRGAPPLPPHLRRDIGLPPDADLGGRSFWDHQ